ncbi:MAG: hypothetical protein V3V57_16455 [Spirochaetia bacterium]
MRSLRTWVKIGTCFLFLLLLTQCTTVQSGTGGDARAYTEFTLTEDEFLMEVYTNSAFSKGSLGGPGIPALDPGQIPGIGNPQTMVDSPHFFFCCTLPYPVAP